MPGEGTPPDPGPETPQAQGVEEGVWRYARAERASVIVDAADYFALMQQAMLKARRRIFLIGWDFHTRIHLTHGRRWWQRPFRRGYPSRLVGFITWLVRRHRGLDVRILKWNTGAIQFALRPRMLWDVLRWAAHRRITFKFDTAHPVACSHHQKVVVLDDRLAVCGGIDMTDRRWDTREHREADPRRRSVGGKLYGPWHDTTMMMEGPVAAVLAEMGEERWRRAGGDEMPRIAPATDSLWPEPLAAQFENIEIGIARTSARYCDWEAVGEILALFRRHIREARRFIYAESQYFASRAVAEAIVARMQQPDPPEIVIVHPANADGWLEQQAMDHARAELVRAIQAADQTGRFTTTPS